MPKLTERFVADLATPAKGSKIHFDNGHRQAVSGFSVRITAKGSVAFVLNYWTKAGRERRITIGRYPSFIAARVAAKKHRYSVENGGDPLADRKRERELTREEAIVDKWLSLNAQGIDPGFGLYRAYDPTGDLLYVGVSLQPLSRLRQHQKGNAEWSPLVFRILIEPFETREQLLAAEQLAIKTEFPKFNVVHNGHRQPFLELAKLNDGTKQQQRVEEEAMV